MSVRVVNVRDALPSREVYWAPALFQLQFPGRRARLSHISKTYPEPNADDKFFLPSVISRDGLCFVTCVASVFLYGRHSVASEDIDFER